MTVAKINYFGWGYAYVLAPSVLLAAVCRENGN